MYTNLTSRPEIICLCADLKVKKIQLEIAEITSCQTELLQFIFKIINLVLYFNSLTSQNNFHYILNQRNKLLYAVLNIFEPTETRHESIMFQCLDIYLLYIKTFSSHID